MIHWFNEKGRSKATTTNQQALMQNNKKRSRRTMQQDTQHRKQHAVDTHKGFGWKRSDTLNLVLVAVIYEAE